MICGATSDELLLPNATKQVSTMMAQTRIPALDTKSQTLVPQLDFACQICEHFNLRVQTAF
jgi:hypothetical protein